MNEFKDRLKNYRTNVLNLSTKKEMAEKLGISEQLYAMFERGARTPSKNFLATLVHYSNVPESYWLYGIENEYVSDRHNFQCINQTVNELIDSGFIKKDVEFNKDIEDILLTALKADIKHLFLKRK